MFVVIYCGSDGHEAEVQAHGPFPTFQAGVAWLKKTEGDSEVEFQTLDGTVTTLREIPDSDFEFENVDVGDGFWTIQQLSAPDPLDL